MVWNRAVSLNSSAACCNSSVIQFLGIFRISSVVWATSRASDSSKNKHQSTCASVRAAKDLVEESLASCKVESSWWRRAVYLLHPPPQALPSCCRHCSNPIITAVFQALHSVLQRVRLCCHPQVAGGQAGHKEGIPLGRLEIYQGGVSKPKSSFSHPH